MGRRSDARKRLLAAGDRLFREHGFSGVGVAQLCSSAQVNKGSFYHFFSSKQALLLEVLDQAWDETGMFRHWESTVPDRPIGQVKAFLEELFAFHYADQELAGRVRGSLLANIGAEVGSGDADVTHKLELLLKREESAFESVLRAAAELGEVSLGNPAHCARTVVACVRGLLMTAKVKDDLSILAAAEVDLLRLVGAGGHV